MPPVLATWLLIAALVAVPLVAMSQETPPPLPEAPFGLTWAMRKQTLSGLGIETVSQLTTPFGESCVVSRLPKELADQQYAVLSFGYDDQLMRIVAVGGGFEQDRDGGRISSRFTEIQALLERKYGTGKSERHTEKQLEGDNFALGLQAKKNWMYTEYSAGEMRIQLSVFWEASKTYWRLIFEHRPGMERLEGERRKTDKDAL